MWLGAEENEDILETVLNYELAAMGLGDEDEEDDGLYVSTLKCLHVQECAELSSLLFLRHCLRLFVTFKSHI